MDGRSPLLDDDAWYGWEAEESDQSWLLSYVDVLSVILAMLLVLLVSELQDNGPAVSIEPAPSPNSAATIAVKPIAVEPIAVPAIKPVLVAVVTPAADELVPLPEQEETTTTDPNEITTQLMGAPAPMQIDGVTMTPTETGVTVKIAEVVLFDSARADLKPGADPVLGRVATLLDELGEVEIAVEGHTDDRQIQGGAFGSNWELAAARSSAVTAFLLQQGLPARHLRVVSYADTRPVADNGSAEGRARNRRVELRVQFLSRQH